MLIWIKAVPSSTRYPNLMDALAFALASLALLATPGPTNTLLLTSGAVAGFRSSLGLLWAELLGYLLAIATLMVVLEPLLASHGGLKLALQAACAGYLVFTARGLWIRAEVSRGKIVGFDKVFVTTLLNPKAFIFALTIIPGDQLDGFVTRLPWLAALSVMIVAVGMCWIYAGAAVRTAPGNWLSAAACCRAGAVVLMAFAALLSWSAMASALNLYAGLASLNGSPEQPRRDGQREHGDQHQRHDVRHHVGARHPAQEHAA
jgi:threonine/homoserine/homoserine lactone efflux protein